MLWTSQVEIVAPGRLAPVGMGEAKPEQIEIPAINQATIAARAQAFPVHRGKHRDVAKCTVPRVAPA